MLTDIGRAELCATLYRDQSDVTWDKQYFNALSHAAIKRVDGRNCLFRRGSQDPLDWYRDEDVLPWDWPGLGPVHAGFLAGVFWTYKEIEADLGDETFELIGHSLGAAEIILQGGLLAASGKRPAAVVALEPPRVAFRGGLCPDDVTRCYRNGSDPVCDVPTFPFVVEKPPILLSGAAAPGDTSIMREHHIACVIDGLRKLHGR